VWVCVREREGEYRENAPSPNECSRAQLQILWRELQSE